MNARPLVVAALLVTGTLVALGCAGRPEENPQLRQVRSELSELKDEVRSLRRDAQARTEKIAELGARERLLETRLGLRPFRPKVLKSGQKSWRFLPDEAQLIEAYGQTPRRVQMQAYTQSYDAYVVAVWATWCKPCTSPEELEQLRRLKGQLERQGSTVIGVAIDSLKKVQTHRKAPRWHYPVWHRDDANIEWLPKAFIKKVGLSLPLFLVVSGNGQVLYWHSAPLSDGIREEMVSAALSHRPPHALPETSERKRRRSRRRRR